MSTSKCGWTACWWVIFETDGTSTPVVVHLSWMKRLENRLGTNLDFILLACCLQKRNDVLGEKEHGYALSHPCVISMVCCMTTCSEVSCEISSGTEVESTRPRNLCSRQLPIASMNLIFDCPECLRATIVDPLLSWLIPLCFSWFSLSSMVTGTEFFLKLTKIGYGGIIYSWNYARLPSKGEKSCVCSLFCCLSRMSRRSSTLIFGIWDVK